jgi:ribosome modulation factor
MPHGVWSGHQQGEKQMAKLPQTVLDFERGMADYRRGLRRCPFTVTSRVEPWLDGWETAQGMSRR